MQSEKRSQWLSEQLINIDCRDDSASKNAFPLERDGLSNDDDCNIGDDQKETMGEQVPLMHCPLLRHLKLETAQPDHRDGDEFMIMVI